MSYTNEMPQDIIRKAFSVLKPSHVDNVQSLSSVLLNLKLSRNIPKQLTLFLIVDSDTMLDLLINRTYVVSEDITVIVSDQNSINSGHLATYISKDFVINILGSDLLSNKELIFERSLLFSYETENLFLINDISLKDEIKLVENGRKNILQVGDSDWNPTKENLESVEKAFKDVSETTELITNNGEIHLSEVDFDSIDEPNILGDVEASNNNFIAKAMTDLKYAMKTDEMYAWSWQCNIAMPIRDELNVTPRQANEAAARLMHHIFDVDITKTEMYIDLIEKIEKLKAQNE